MKLGCLIQVTSGPASRHWTGANPAAWSQGALPVYRHYAHHLSRRGDTISMVWRPRGMTRTQQMPMFPPLNPLSTDPTEAALADPIGEFQGLQLLKRVLDENARSRGDTVGELIVYDGYLDTPANRDLFDRMVSDRARFLVNAGVTTWAIDGSALGTRGSLAERAGLIWNNKGGERFMIEAFPSPTQKHWQRYNIDACANAVNTWGSHIPPKDFPGRLVLMGCVKVDAHGLPVRHPTEGYMYAASTPDEERAFASAASSMGYDLLLTGMEDGINNISEANHA